MCAQPASAPRSGPPPLPHRATAAAAADRDRDGDRDGDASAAELALAAGTGAGGVAEPSTEASTAVGGAGDGGLAEQRRALGEDDSGRAGGRPVPGMEADAAVAAADPGVSPPSVARQRLLLETAHRQVFNMHSPPCQRRHAQTRCLCPRCSASVFFFKLCRFRCLCVAG